VNKILRAGNEHEKEYAVTVNKSITDGFIEGMATGVPMLGQMTKHCTVERVADRVFRIVLVQGLNRQIRRMCEHFGYGVEKLERTRIMHVSLAGIASGDWRDFTDEELDELDTLLEGSSGLAKAKKSSRQAPGSSKPNTDGSAGASSDDAGTKSAKKKPAKRRAKPKKRKPGAPGARIGKQAGPNKRKRRR
jgi:23S rRNA pseudouridine2604 synthase